MLKEALHSTSLLRIGKMIENRTLLRWNTSNFRIEDNHKFIQNKIEKKTKTAKDKSYKEK